MIYDEKELMKTILDEIRMMREEIQSMKIVNVKQEQNLREHMRRSNALEESLDVLKKELKPLQKHVQMVDFFFKALGGIAVLATIAEFILSRTH